VEFDDHYLVAWRLVFVLRGLFLGSFKRLLLFASFFRNSKPFYYRYPYVFFVEFIILNHSIFLDSLLFIP